MYRLRLVPDKTKVAFMKGAKTGLIVSALLSFISVVLYFHPGLTYGIDFAGGVVVEAAHARACRFRRLAQRRWRAAASSMSSCSNSARPMTS